MFVFFVDSDRETLDENDFYLFYLQFFCLLDNFQQNNGNWPVYSSINVPLSHYIICRQFFHGKKQILNPIIMSGLTFRALRGLA